MIVIDALISIALNILGLIFVIAYLVSCIVKAIIIILKPLWFIFVFVSVFMRSIFTPYTEAAPWTPDERAVNFIHAFPGFGLLITGVGMSILILATIKAFKYGK